MKQEDNYTKVLADVINSASDTCDHLRLKGSRHGNYKYYSHKSVVEKIINEGYFFLSDGSRWNDKIDAFSFNSGLLLVRPLILLSSQKRSNFACM